MAIPTQAFVTSNVTLRFRDSAEEQGYIKGAASKLVKRFQQGCAIFVLVVILTLVSGLFFKDTTARTFSLALQLAFFTVLG